MQKMPQMGKSFLFFNTKWFPLASDSIIIEKSGMVIGTNGLIQTKLSNRLMLAFQQVLIIPSNAKHEDVYVFGNNLNGRLENSESLRST